MAVVNAYAPLNLINPSVWYGWVVEATSTQIVITDGYNTAAYLGQGFQYRGDDVVAGTLTGYAQFTPSGLAGEAYGFSIPAPIAANFIAANDLPGLFSIILSGPDTIIGSAYSDYIAAHAGDDVIYGGGGQNYIDGGPGLDTAIYDFGRGTYSISGSAGYLTVQGGGVVDTLVSVERLAFSDGTLAFDENAIQTFRLYQAAFDRTPDLGGVSFWVTQIDAGIPLVQAAANFIGSAEFQGLYGPSPSNEQFVDLLYQNVLDRMPDESGYAFWNGQMAGGMTRDQVLLSFSESPENQANTAPATAGGIWLV